ncbi:methylated-DNA--[protein]-cysteine S-methyltransferase [Thermomonospora catenispora]|uniref:methylated-DNA--[protein]-cysteine S-methyltransferase n=1 Tax=Thermomonospora catenispora TaxID=2493090 RepID=UPI00111FD9F4|nr:methylated-DNA--[protein]-cysteine S-methyltransferase [Thermomonospora catenispora]TNY34961.1 methylated-DNA--[protein]-cysteine S-methyltransferase [Thermomonospora catenispora]
MGGTVAFGTVGTPLGRMLVAVSEAGVLAVDFRDDPAVRARTAERSGLVPVEDPDRTAAAVEQLAAYFAGELREFALPVDWRLTTRVQRRILSCLRETVPYGSVVTYGRLGERSGTGVPARAVGQVMGANPIPVIVPCHRVVAENGLGGYSGGTGPDVKRRLLALEGVLPPALDFGPAEGP